MKKTLLVSIAAVTALSGANIEDALKTGKASGQIRAAYVNQDNALGADTYATALGGVLKYETGVWNDLKFGVAAYISQKLPFATGDNEKANNDLFADNADSYVYLGEAYIDYTRNDFALRIGRQQIDTPLADTDDIRMHPNTFEAAIATYKGFEGSTLVGGVVKRFAGYDSGNDISKFKKLDGADSHGAAIAGITNESVENLALQGWYYGIDNIANVLYADATYAMELYETSGIEVAAQFGQFNESLNSTIDGTVYGVGASFNIDMLTVGAAYNEVNSDTGKAIVNGFGGGPYFTSMEEMTIDGLEDAKAYQFNAELDMSDAGIDGLTLAALYGKFKGKTGGLDAKVSEFDIVLAYDINENVCADMSYATIDDKNKNTGDSGTDGGYDRFLLRLSYSF
ncbi:outer membrane porin [Sulfuricurvum kujiense DSM 16994]|uniref:Outer membrane porin n=1 Tax=Sulfuricurvum kujiense (strain ATCC BAA-921 / DSM 16994 / JCM 11577 / YK-1) TaxID=709032 RepID=E4U0C0_SULKY|nr:OprD family outer membrane porin [Sulfuricurvum kujiense]ADR33217.1 outer membrane porin [Sulfuricurvum kujiense DSM 16994]